MSNGMTSSPDPLNGLLKNSEEMNVSRQLDEEIQYSISLLPPILRNVILALHRDVGAPVGLITGTVLSAVSLACQTFIEIQSPDGRVKPCSLYHLVIADSGERKSTVYSLVMKPFFEFEKEDKKGYNSALQRYDTDMLIWNVRKKLILKQLNKKIEENEDYYTEQESLNLHILKRPEPPKRMKLIYTDTTPEAMQQGLHENISAAGLMSDEASVFFEGRAKNNLGFLNELWDGKQIDIERRSRKSFSLDSPYFTMLLMVQHDIFIQYFKKHGKSAAGSGFLSRFLISLIPSSTWPRLSSSNTVNSEKLASFHNEIHDLLSNLRGQLNNNCKPKILKLALCAQPMLEDLHLKIEEMTACNAKNNTIKSSLMKLPENVLRIAGLLHYFQDRESDEISHDTLLCAIRLAEYYRSQMVSLFSKVLATPEQDADYVEQWLRQHLPFPISENNIFKVYSDDSDNDDDDENERNKKCILKSKLRRHISSSHFRRDKKRLDAAIKYLEEEERIRIKKRANANGSISEFIYLMSNDF